VPEYLNVVGPKLSLSVELFLSFEAKFARHSKFAGRFTAEPPAIGGLFQGPNLQDGWIRCQFEATIFLQNFRRMYPSVMR
jgi:hypothetical protein